MERMLNRILTAAFYFLLILLPFGIKKAVFILGSGSSAQGVVFLYAADIAALALIMLVILIPAKWDEGSRPLWLRFPRFFGFRSQNDVVFYLLILFLILATTSIFVAASKTLAIFSFTRLLLYILVTLAVVKVLRSGIVSFDTVLRIFVVSAVVQSVIGFLQFVAQKSLGLWWLGESVLRVGEAGVATIKVAGATFLRAYGTFPHPNVFGAYLVIGLLACMYLWMRVSTNSESNTNMRMKGRFKFMDSLGFIRYSLMVSAIFLIILGLTLTFSRTAWFVAALGLVSFVILSVGEGSRRAYVPVKRDQNDIIKISAVLMLSALTVFIILRSLIMARSDFSLGEPAVVDRAVYSRLGLEIIKEQPLGVGIGNQQQYALSHGLYEKFDLIKPWQKEPVHSLYLLIGDEVGIPGLILFFIFLARLLISNIKYQISKNIENGKAVKRTLSIKNSVAVSFLLSLLLLGLFDHFLWDLPQGQLMLWLVIGLAIGVKREVDYM